MNFANIVWQQDTPKNQFFDDFYFSSDAAESESIYNFLDHNFLEYKFSSLSSNQKFVICETGFGAGLNFILTMELWNKCAAFDATLEYFSFEKYPIAKSDLVQIAKQFSHLDNYDDLLRVYNPKQGTNRYDFGSVVLYLMVDDVNAIDNYNLPKIDSWYLDGFAPAKNASMWTENFFTNMGQLSKANTSFATFTASSKVRRALIENSFDVKKDTGFGKKREMMYGDFIPIPIQININITK